MSLRWKGIVGGYSPLARAYRRWRPGRTSLLSPAGRAIWRFVAANGLTVMHGPFEGMIYPTRARGHAVFLGAKLLGSYERELHAVLEEVIAGGYPNVVDVGAGEGYYVVGLALRMRETTTVTAFELDAGDNALRAMMARINGVSDIISDEGECTPSRLQQTLGEDSFLLCDCEGYEHELLRPDVVPALRSATMLVELHPHVALGIEDTLRDRFAATHDITSIGLERRDPREYAELANTSPREAYLIVSEGWLTDEEWRESGRSWLYLRRRAGAAATVATKAR